MNRGLADTSLFIARESGRALDTARVPDELAVSVIAIGELRTGVLAATTPNARARRLDTVTAALALRPVPVDERVAEQWALLRVPLRDADLRMPLNNSWIAATAISLGVPVVTQDDDVPTIGDLTVIQV